MRRIILIVMLAAVVLVGCSASARYRLKHWFFDIPNETAESAQVDESGKATAAPKPVALPQPKPRFVSFHPPYVKRECSACHNNEQRMHPFEDFIDVCSDCHDRFFGDDVGHFPVAEGECLTCHQMHRSTHKALLTSAVTDMCIDCHDEPEDLSEDAHNGGEGVDNCTRCHDPHFGESPLLKKGVKPIAED